MSTVGAVQEAVRAAAAAGAPLRVVGQGTWTRAGRPVPPARTLAVADLTGIVEFVPGDLTMTARAGTPLAELQAAARAEGQWLPLDPWGGDAGSLGATLATATAGPSAGALGQPRDLVLGLEAVTGTGEVVRGGGRVVKNVAGFDLVRLMIGAWGTLGVLTEASVRLRALPEADETVALPAPLPGALDDWLARLRVLPLAPVAMELVSDGAARTLALPDGAALLVRLAGNAQTVAAQRGALATVAELAAAPADVWMQLRTAEPTDLAAVLRLSAPPARLGDAWREATRLVAALQGERGSAYAHASVQRGVARVVVPSASDEALVTALSTQPPPGLTRIFEQLPAPLWPRLAPSAADDRLSRGVRRAFDPHRVLNPGILGESPPEAAA